MMYNYVKFPDETQIAYSDVLDDTTVRIAIERPTDGGFDAAICLLPSYGWSDIAGFTQDEIAGFTDFLQHNAPLIYRLARESKKRYA